MGIITERRATLGKKTIGWTSLLDAWGKTAFGELDCAAHKFDVVSKICAEAGWVSMAWQARIFKSVIECIKGDLRTAQKTLDAVRSTDTSKHNKKKKQKKKQNKKQKKQTKTKPNEFSSFFFLSF
jgi:hypothetical protein